MIGLQSFCLRGFEDNATVADKVKESGLSAIEICGRHADFSNPANFKKVIEVYNNRSVRIVSVGVNTLSGDQVHDRSVFECARLAGLRVMSVSFKIDSFEAALRSAAALSEEYQIRIGIHNHGGRHWLGSSEALAWALAKGGPRVGLCIDTAWAMHSHEDPLAMAKEFRDRLFLVHIKDFVFDRSGKEEDVIVGTGNLALGRLDELLAEAGFDGPAILEYEGDVANPLPALTECVARIKAEMPRLARGRV